MKIEKHTIKNTLKVAFTFTLLSSLLVLATGCSEELPKNAIRMSSAGFADAKAPQIAKNRF